MKPTWNLFPDLTTEDVQGRVRWAWNLHTRLPTPRFKPKCPACRSTEFHARLWRLFPRQAKISGRLSHRCDVNIKCTWCGFVMTFGVALTQDEYDVFIRGVKGRDGGGGVTIHWREAKELFDAEA